jgi:heptosyltransferase-2
MNRPEHVLVKVPNWLGDLVMFHPALRALDQALRRERRDARLSVLVPEGLAGFYRATPWIDRIVTHPWPVGWRVPRHLAAASAIRRHRPEHLLLATRSFESALWGALARVPRRSGVAREGRSWLLSAAHPEPGAWRSGHAADVFPALLSTLAGLALEVTPAPPEVDPGAARRVEEWLSRQRREPLRPLVVLAPAAAVARKRWPAQRWAELADSLAERDVECLLMVAPWERRHAEDVVARTRRPPLASSELDVASLVALAARADGWIGNDSGPSHVAAALGTPTLGVFVSSDPARSAPRGARVATIGPASGRDGPECAAVLAAWNALGQSAGV